MNGEARTVFIVDDSWEARTSLARMMSKMSARSVAELVQLGARVGVEIEPALSAGAAGLSWNQTQCPISKPLE